MAFTHLHVHSEYSLLDGLTQVPHLVAHARDMGFDSLALTDHGVMFGVVRFYQQARKAGIKPILGCELYVAARSRHDRDPVDRRSSHLTVLAQDLTGYRNLVQLATLAQLEGHYYKPRVDRELLAEHGEGLIVLSGCASGEAAQLILQENIDAAGESLRWYKELLGDRFYVELQHHELEFLPELNRWLVRLAGELDLPLVATNDVHYARPEDVTAHEVLLCIQTGATLSDEKRMRYDPTYYMRSEEEMRSLFAELPAAVDNTCAIAERCNVSLEVEGYRLPRYAVPDGRSAAQYLRQLCDEGLARRFDPVTPAIRERLDYELAVIGQMGFDDYFLVVWDLCRHARDGGIWWNVRGSGAASIVAYSLGVTNIDPLANDLIFERFLNPSRISMPDIDLDFPDDQRDEMIRYAYDRYGHDRVAQIITFGTMGARAAIRDSGRVLEIPARTVDRVARLVPAVAGKPCSIDDTLREPGPQDENGNEFYVPELAELYRQDDDVQRLIDTARSIEGVTRHASTHAAGVVIGDGPLIEYVPLHRPTRESAASAPDLPPVTQYNMKDIEALHLLKVDFLGLSTLTIMRRAAQLIERHHGIRLTLDNIPLDDPAIYDLLCSGNVTGVFQVESAGMRRLLRDMQPRRFENIVAAVALYRPGPMVKIPEYLACMHGTQTAAYAHPALEPILAETYGVCVYQEQIIRIFRDLAGYTAGEADTVRRAVSKKVRSDLLEHGARFVERAEARGIERKTGQELFASIEDFARYGFNKAHAADYAVIVCQTAYIKAHYPVEYAAALLSVDRDDTERIALLAADCRALGIKLLRPDIDHSDVDFAIEDLDHADLADPAVSHRRGIRFGLAGIKNVGQASVEAILRGRGDRPFESLEDLCRRVDMRAVGKRALESLVRVGALDRYGPRGSLLAAIDRLMSASSTHFQAAEVGQLSLFGDGPSGPGEAVRIALPDAPEIGMEQLQWEKELLGLYVTAHPLVAAAPTVADHVTAMIGGIDGSMAGQPVTLAGVVASVRHLTTRKGEAMAFVRLEDLESSIEVTLFPRALAATRSLWEVDRMVLVQGRVDFRDERVQIVADRAEPFGAATAEEVALDDAEEAPGAGPEDTGARPAPAHRVQVILPRTADHRTDIALLGEVFRTLVRYQGSDPFYIVIPNGPDTVELEFPNSATRYCMGLVSALEALLGTGHVEARPLAAV